MQMLQQTPKTASFPPGRALGAWQPLKILKIRKDLKVICFTLLEGEDEETW